MTPESSVIKDFQKRYVRVGQARWDRTASELTISGNTAKQPSRSAAALDLLIDAKGGGVTREEFESLIWGGAQMDYSVVSQCIKTLRRALEPAPGGSGYVETVSRVGYRLAVEVEEESDPTPAPTASSCGIAH